MLDRPHRVDRVEGVRGEGQRAHVRRDATVRTSGENASCRAHDAERDIDAERPRALIGRPPKDLGVLGLVPEIRLEQRPSGEIGKKALEETSLAFEVVGGGCRALERREVDAHVGPERLLVRTRGRGRRGADQRPQDIGPGRHDAQERDEGRHPGAGREERRIDANRLDDSAVKLPVGAYLAGVEQPGPDDIQLSARGIVPPGDEGRCGQLELVARLPGEPERPDDPEPMVEGIEENPVQADGEPQQRQEREAEAPPAGRVPVTTGGPRGRRQRDDRQERDEIARAPRPPSPPDEVRGVDRRQGCQETGKERRSPGTQSRESEQTRHGQHRERKEHDDPGGGTDEEAREAFDQRGEVIPEQAARDRVAEAVAGCSELESTDPEVGRGRGHDGSGESRDTDR